MSIFPKRSWIPGVIGFIVGWGIFAVEAWRSTKPNPVWGVVVAHKPDGSIILQQVRHGNTEPIRIIVGPFDREETEADPNAALTVLPAGTSLFITNAPKKQTP